MARVELFVLFLTSEGTFSIRHDINCGFLQMSFTRVKNFPCIPSFVVIVVFNHKMVLDFANLHILPDRMLNVMATLKISLEVP